MFIRH